MDRIESLRSQLLKGLMWPLFLLLIIGSALSYWIAWSFANRAYDYALFESARSLAQLVRFDHQRVTVDLPQPALEILLADSLDQIFYKVGGPTVGFVTGNAALPEPDVRHPGDGRTVFYYSHARDGHAIRVAAIAVVDNASQKMVWVQVAETLTKRHRFAQEILLAVTIPQVILIAAAGFLVFTGVQRGLAPLKRVAREIGDRSHRDLTPIPAEGVPLEMRPVTRALNDLLQRLQQALSAQQRFIADAAHQLRTPLAGINIQTERAKQATDMAAMQPALEQLGVATKHAIRLANQLLTLARAEPGADALHRFERVDLAALARAACMEWVPRALVQQMDLGFVGPTGAVWIQADALLLSEMLNNLIDNALRYGRRGGSVTVQLEEAVLSVIDDGPGIPETERQHVFERFYRGAGRQQTEGCGLGLAIVREIANLHGGEVAVVSPPEGGTAVCISFPAAAST